jgi:hypothetical protein
MASTAIRMAMKGRRRHRGYWYIGSSVVEGLSGYLTLGQEVVGKSDCRSGNLRRGAKTWLSGDP